MSETEWNILGKSAQPLRQKANAYIKRPNGAVPAWSVCPWGVVGTSPSSSSSSIIKQQVVVRIVAGCERLASCHALLAFPLASALYGCVCACDL